MDRGSWRADQVGERFALAAGGEGRVEQRRGVDPTMDARVGDRRDLAIGPGERDLPTADPAIGGRDRRLGLLAGEPTELRAPDVDTGQDPPVVLLPPRVQDANADTGGEQDAEDERDAEAKKERAAPPRGGLALRGPGRDERGQLGVTGGGFDLGFEGSGARRRGVDGERLGLGHGSRVFQATRVAVVRR